VSEEVNHAMNMTVQLSNPYTDPERHGAQRHRQTDRRHHAKKRMLLEVRSAKSWTLVSKLLHFVQRGRYFARSN